MKMLVRQAQCGDADAFITLMEENRQALYWVACGFFQNQEDVADAIQETILDAYEHIRDLKKAELFRTWLLRILINNCSRIFNYNKKNCSTDEIPEIESAETENDNVEFRQLLNQLPSESRVIFQLYYGEQFTTREIGVILHMKESTVKSRLRRGREQLRRQLQETIYSK